MGEFRLPRFVFALGGTDLPAGPPSPLGSGSDEAGLFSVMASRWGAAAMWASGVWERTRGGPLA